jgi:hypothetical protein
MTIARRLIPGGFHFEQNATSLKRLEGGTQLRVRPLKLSTNSPPRGCPIIRDGTPDFHKRVLDSFFAPRGVHQCGNGPKRISGHF